MVGVQNPICTRLPAATGVQALWQGWPDVCVEYSHMFYMSKDPGESGPANPKVSNHGDRANASRLWLHRDERRCQWVLAIPAITVITGNHGNHSGLTWSQPGNRIIS